MTIDELLVKCNHFPVVQKREHFLDYDERVIYQKDLDQWLAVFTELLGPPVKPAGQPTTREEFALTVNYGGINQEQILYYKKFGDYKMIVMLWPWKDKESITLKIAAIKN